MRALAANGYTIYFNETGYEALHSLIQGNTYSSIFVLVDEHTNEYCLPQFLGQIATETRIEIIEIEAGEDTKTIATCMEIWSILSDLGADRKSLMISLGGGVVTDIGGFVAATYKRGIDFINVPTSLLGMVDAAIGGKNGVDLGSLKNQIGLVSVPKIVIIDSTFLETLSPREMRSGLAEMLKHGLIYDKKYWEQFLDLKTLDMSDFDSLLYRSIEIKNEIVLQDPKEHSIRKALNFGHTLGHAIESHFLTSSFPLVHGEAVAIGMQLESFISMKKGSLSSEEYYQIKYVLTNLYEVRAFTHNDIQSVLDLLIHDKKNEYGKVQFVLLQGIGATAINQIVENELIEAAFEDYFFQ
ncbi:3-dehydroquinate synthase [Flavobacterium aciduliphilum]|uniref:3-dehydroquinate synthase n=1 Tax=Flavobacterium aciduliphilum TaxID=1101402 RepID=A0A328Y9I4_9FLAO|nr:3-dehydroquinate synthase [Flavobacterium aciduliphilum]RAR70678.1 3-dehydroquinate synthase [Flavobacterium aciduliphilum]